MQLAFTPPPPDMPRPSDEEYQRVFQEMNSLPNYEFIVAEEVGKVIGTTVLAILPGIAHNVSPFAVIEYVVVDEKHRSKGIGRQMTEYCKSKAKEAGCYKIMLTSDKRRTEAHEFYKSLGFEASAHGFRLYF